MSIKTGSNFNYSGPRYLDARQGIPKTLSDLKNWKTLIPRGFEVFVLKHWYVYDPELPKDPQTGDFHPRVAQGLGDSDTASISQKAFTETTEQLGDSIQTLINNTWPVEFGDFIGGGFYERGQEVLPNISWRLYRSNNPALTLSPDEVTVNGSTEGVSYNKNSFQPKANISTDTLYKIKVTADHQTVEKDVWYRFGYKRFYGVTSKPTITSAEIRSLESWDWEQEQTLSPLKFNCRGGKYPWFCIPSVLYNPETIECWVGGLRCTDIEAIGIEFTNSYSHKTKYTCIRLGSKQTGVLNIEFR